MATKKIRPSRDHDTAARCRRRANEEHVSSILEMECEVEGTPVDPEDIDRDPGWIAVTRKRSESKKAGATYGAKPPAARSSVPNSALHRRRPEEVKRNVLKNSKMPPLPRDEIKVIVRPRGGLCIGRVGPSTVAEAIWEAAGFDSENADRYINVESITISNQEYEVSAYVAALNATCKGVIRGISLNNDPKTIERKIVNERNPLALDAKRIKKTSTLIVLFDSYRVPNYVSYGGTLIRSTLYRKKIDVCHVCGNIGHRSDVCPTPDAAICKDCKAPLQQGEDNHTCTPKCDLCGGRHRTAAKECRQRYQTPYVVKRRRRLRERATQEQDFPLMDEHLSAKLDTAQECGARPGQSPPPHHQPSATRGRSRSRTRRGGKGGRAASRPSSGSRSRSRARFESRTHAGTRRGPGSRSRSRTHPGTGHGLGERGAAATSTGQPGHTPVSPCRPTTANAGSKPHHSDEANADRGGRQSTLTWANTVRKSTEFDDDRVMHCDLPPEENRDDEIAKLKRENTELKETVNATSHELAEIRKALVALRSGESREETRALTDKPAPASSGEGPMATKRRAVESKLKNTESQIEEMKQTLGTLADSVKTIADIVASLTASVQQIQVALGDPKEGLKAINNRITALEQRYEELPVFVTGDVPASAARVNVPSIIARSSTAAVVEISGNQADDFRGGEEEIGERRTGKRGVVEVGAAADTVCEDAERRYGVADPERAADGANVMWRPRSR
ncbi:hypothetical protein HPB52_008829 [Rhipicephalus sanguineus]|uniref:CCHC-type domain-containing protein n=1 Tax=Rhipicephalus sanguineus TaxID=34632 RepID=A0A9D4QHR4_RHISA|nr:hypothetical protein HPB52_008829 [Rhipicephalus sanguineus]